MRIISQNKNMNLSLDHIHLSTAVSPNCWSIRARDSLWNRPVELAVYSSKEKCNRVFADIVTACSKGFAVVELPPDDEVIL